MPFHLGPQSLQKLIGVKQPLVDVVHVAILRSVVDFSVCQGLRTPAEEAILVSQGKSETLNSRHLTGDAVDLCAIINGVANWEEKYYHLISDAMFFASAKLNIPIKWGGSWKTLKDFGHFELNRNFYP